MQTFVDVIRRAVARTTGLSGEDVKLEAPRDAALGDLAFPCFVVAKAAKRPPAAVAADLARSLTADLAGIQVSAAGPYLNFRIDRADLARTVVGDVLRAGARYGGSDEGAGRTILIDFSSPNIAKPMHVGHLRSTILGAALGRIFRLLG